MVAFSSLALGLSAISAVLAAPAPAPVEKRGDFNFMMGPDHPLSLARRNLTRRSTNYNQDYTTGGTVNFTPSNGAFSVNWNTQDDFVVGVGWNPGSTAPITHTGTFTVSSGLGSLSVYGWTTNPLVEYYVMEENIGISGLGSEKGTVSSDGGTYTIYEGQRVNEPSIEGTSTFNQYISVRSSGTTSGTVTVENHFKAWAALGMTLGTFNFQVIAVESWSGSGSAQQSVSNSGSTSPPPPPTTTSAGGTHTTTTAPGTHTTTTAPGVTGGSCSAEWGQCGGIGWTGPKCCNSGTTCQVGNAYYSQCLP